MSATISAADVTRIAALVAAGSGLVAALVSIANLTLAVTRERPAMRVFTREWAADRQGRERYITAFVTNIGRRSNSVVAMGLVMEANSRQWTIDDGVVTPELPTRLDDGQTATMTWMRDELGPEFVTGRATVVGCFAIDGRGRRVSRKASDGRTRRALRPTRRPDQGIS